MNGYVRHFEPVAKYSPVRSESAASILPFGDTETGAPVAVTVRARWMGELARAPIELLESWAASLAARQGGLPRYTWLRRPEIGLAMVRARAGGTGEQFNLGEMTMTRCALRMDAANQAVVGLAYVQGRAPRKSELAALADAMLQIPAESAAVRTDLLAPVRAHHAACATEQALRAQATRVEFYTLAREASE